MRTAALDRLELESDLATHSTSDQLRLVYQPVIELRDGRDRRLRGLAPLGSPDAGRDRSRHVHPASPRATAPSCDRPVGAGGGCRTAANGSARSPSELTMAVNLSARQIAAPDIVGHVAAALEHSGLPAASLILEMTESVLVQDPRSCRARLEQLRALGVRLAIDDFGTGYSSLSYLRQFPIDILKIDKSFTDTITARAQLPPIVHGLLDLAKTLGITTVAEGIELEVQRDTLRDQHCEFGQGFLFSEPLDPADAMAMLARPGKRSTPLLSGCDGRRLRPSPADRSGPGVAGSTLVVSTSLSTTRSSMGFSAVCSASTICSTSTREACHADQCPDTNAHNESADTYVTLLSRPSPIEMGIMISQKMVNQPLTRRMKAGSPWIDAHNDFTTPMGASFRASWLRSLPRSGGRQTGVQRVSRTSAIPEW